MSETDTCLRNTHKHTDTHTHAHGEGVKDRRRGEEHRMDGVSPWKWLFAMEIVLDKW